MAWLRKVCKIVELEICDLCLIEHLIIKIKSCSKT